MPERGVPTDLSWLRESIPAADSQKLEAANKDNAEGARVLVASRRATSRR